MDYGNEFNELNEFIKNNMPKEFGIEITVDGRYLVKVDDDPTLKDDRFVVRIIDTESFKDFVKSVRGLNNE